MESYYYGNGLKCKTNVVMTRGKTFPQCYPAKICTSMDIKNICSFIACSVIYSTYSSQCCLCVRHSDTRMEMHGSGLQDSS